MRADEKEIKINVFHNKKQPAHHVQCFKIECINPPDSSLLQGQGDPDPQLEAVIQQNFNGIQNSYQSSLTWEELIGRELRADMVALQHPNPPGEKISIAFEDKYTIHPERFKEVEGNHQRRTTTLPPAIWGLLPHHHIGSSLDLG